MKCETCRGPVIGTGFFQRIVHEKKCVKITVIRTIFEQAGIPEHVKRCEICGENMAPLGAACDECSEEIAADSPKP